MMSSSTPHTPQVHLLWRPGSGVHLWVAVASSSASGIAAARSARSIPADGLPKTLAGFVAARSFRHTTSATLQIAGEEKSLTLPTQLLSAEDVVGLVDALRVENPTYDHPAISGEVRFIATLVDGLTAAVTAGQFAPTLTESGHFFGSLTLVPSLETRTFLQQMRERLPVVLRVNSNERAVKDLVDYLVPGIIRRESYQLDPQSLHPFISAAVTGALVSGGSKRAARRLADLASGAEEVGTQLFLQLNEADVPSLGGDDEATVLATSGLTEAEAEAPRVVAGDGDNPTGRWPVHIALQVDGSPLIPLDEAMLDEDLHTLIEAHLTAAVTAWPPLADAVRDEDGIYRLTDSAVLALIDEGAPRMRERGIIVAVPKSWVRVAAALKLSVDSTAQATHGRSRLSLEEIVSYRWQVSLGDTRLTDAEMRELAEAASPLVNLRGQWIRVDEHSLAAVRKFLRARDTHGDRKEKSLAALLQDYAAIDAAALVDPLEAHGWVGQLLAASTDAKAAEIPQVTIPETVTATLRPYQQRGVSWLAAMSRYGVGAILADDMGLGKTLQVLALLAVHAADHDPESIDSHHPALVICPVSLIRNWAAEAARFTPNLVVYIHHGTTRATGPQLAREFTRADLILTTYSLIHRDLGGILETGVEFGHLICDEAQFLKNARTAAARAVRHLPARHRIALTGTPVENRLEELRAVMDLVNPGILGNPTTFRNRFAVPIERDGEEGPLQRLKELTSPFILRREKTDRSIISDLPDKVESTRLVSLTTEQASLYQAVVDGLIKDLHDAQSFGSKEDISRRGAVFSAMTRLKQICNHPAHYLADDSPLLKSGRHRSQKLAVTEELITQALDNDRKTLLFTQYTSFGTRLQEYFTTRLRQPVGFLHGGLSPTQRADLVEHFQAGELPLLILSLKAGGTGLNLTAATQVIHFDRWWNPAVENQATDRAYRIGQTTEVDVIRLVTEGTIEQRIDEVITGKKELAGAIIGAGEGWVANLDDEQLTDLMSLREEVGVYEPAQARGPIPRRRTRSTDSEK